MRYPPLDYNSQKADRNEEMMIPVLLNLLSQKDVRP